MDFTATLFPLLVGLIAGGLGALLGLGGGIVVVPSLELLAPHFLHQDLPIQEAVAASQLGVLAVAVASSAGYLAKNLVQIRTAYLLAPYTVAGGVLGSLLGLVMNARPVGLVLATLQLYVGIELIRGMQRADTNRETSTMPTQGLLGASFAGLMSGLLGIGGGTVQVPVLNLLLGLAFRVAVATSTFMMGLTAIANVLIYGASGRLHLSLAAPVALGILLGARLTSGFASRVPVRALKMLFAILVWYSAFLLFRKYL